MYVVVVKEKYIGAVRIEQKIYMCSTYLRIYPAQHVVQKG